MRIQNLGEGCLSKSAWRPHRRSKLSSSGAKTLSLTKQALRESSHWLEHADPEYKVPQEEGTQRIRFKAREPVGREKGRKE